MTMTDTAAPQSVPCDIADGTVQRLDPQFVPFQRVVGWIVTAFVSASFFLTVGITWLTGELPRWANLLLAPTWVLVTAASGWLSHAWPPLEYRHTSYRLDEEGIEIQSGVVWRAVTSVPRSRVQHIDVSQGPLERSYGLGRLVIHTAGTVHSRVELPGLNHSVALALRNHLLPRGTDDAV
jgi:membrane protein YdbS with pleckstrin-like domain